MSELNTARSNRSEFRKYLLATASAAILLTTAYGLRTAKADDQDTDRPVLWIELGGQLSRLDDSQEIFAPAFLESRPSTFGPSQPLEHMPFYSIDEDGSVSFEPENSSWVLSASIRYGRSVSTKNVTQNIDPHEYTAFSGGVRAIPSAGQFASTVVRNDETHMLLDFQAGKDFGLGLFGQRGTSVLSLGVRYAQFSTNSNINIKSDPDWQNHYVYNSYYHRLHHHGQVYHSNRAEALAGRSFHGIGPSIAWNASAPVVGNSQAGEIRLDWGLQAAVLFGRQRARVHHQTTSFYHPFSNFGTLSPTLVYRNTPADQQRSHTVTVPNAGGFAGVSFHYANAKISAGYRADFFWGAMDGGIDARKTENVGFYGPFASVSIGLGE